MQNLFKLVGAVLPIVLFIVLLMVLKLSSKTSSITSFLAAVVVGGVIFRSPIQSILIECQKGIWNTLVIYYVVFTAMLIYEALSRADMFTHIRVKINDVIKNELLQVLFIGWGFTSFLQSITGFGVPVAVAAPILVGMGIAPIQAVMICILGHAWGGTYGTLAIAWDSLLVQASVSPQDAGRIALLTCTMLWIYNLICGFAICFIYRKGKIMRRDIFCTVAISTTQGAVQLAVAQFNTSVACFFASICALGTILILDITVRDHKSQKPPISKCSIKDILMPYMFLVVLVVVLLFCTPVNVILSKFKIGPHINNTIYSPMSIFTHSGTLLMATALFTYFYYFKKGYIKEGLFFSSVKNTFLKSIRSIIPILFLIMMSKVMDGTGQIMLLSTMIAGALGSLYPLFSPFIGMLGSFISSSNMSSNILFTGFQKNAAIKLGIDQAVILAAQTTGGSIGNLTATSNILLGLSTTGEHGREGEVMRKLAPIAIFSCIISSIFIMIVLHKGSAF